MKLDKKLVIRSSLVSFKNSNNKGFSDEYKCAHYDDDYMDSDHWYGRIFFLKGRSKGTRKERKNKMNEEKQEEQPKKESSKFLFIYVGFFTLMALGLILALLIFSK